ncbi:MAG: hypothetical protein JRF33_13305 [Deltaproteobacteria bacterium]|nr:hypothetical protein [Deltaproteobacteria bacterium]
MRKSWLIVLSLVLATSLAVGCGGGDDPDPCEGLTLCTTAGDMQCNSGGTAIQTCAANADACLVWSDTTTCGARQACDASGTDPVCACNDTCNTENATQCATDTVQTCTADADGCMAWANTTDCTASNETCVDGACVGGSVCTDGETRCEANWVETCANDAWVQTTDCTPDGDTCQVDDSVAQCQGGVVCTDGETRCEANWVETCANNAWGQTTDCATDTCVIDNTVAVCQAAVTCTDGETRCVANWIETCASDVWAQTTDCATDVCVIDADTAVCQTPIACNPACDANACMECDTLVGTCVTFCDADEVCNAGTCETTVTGPLGDPCSADADCDSGWCLTEMLNGLPMGYCAAECDGDGNCPSDGLCMDLGIPVCLDGCDPTGNDCREGYECIDLGEGLGVCWAACDADAQCGETGYCAIDDGFCTCPPGEHVDETIPDCVYDDCDYLVCEDLNMSCDATAGCSGDCAACDACLDVNDVLSTNHCYPADATWGGECVTDADCPGTGMPGSDTFCDGLTGGTCVQVDGPDFVADGQACAGDTGSMGVTAEGTNYCFEACAATADCRPGYYCYTDLTAGICLAINDCATDGCNDEGELTCGDDGYCWLDGCAADPCSGMANSDEVCTGIGDDYRCGCDAGYFWDADTMACELFVCDAAVLTSAGLTGQDSCDGTAIYDAGANGESSCTGYNSIGNELVYSLEVPAGNLVDIEMVNSSFDASLWVTTSCSDLLGSSCVVGGDDPETVSFSNDTDAMVTYYVIADAYSGCGTFDLIVTMGTSPCASDPCAAVANSDGVCMLVDASTYACGCDDGFDWDDVNLTCEAFACSATAIAVGDTAGDTCNGSQNTYTMGDGDCGVGWSANSWEELHELTVGAGESFIISVAYDADAVDAFLWATTSCGDVLGASCVASADTNTDGTESIVIDTAGTYYVVVDGYYADECGAYTLTVAAN